MTPQTTDILEQMGWEFMPTGSEEWTWLKFDGDALTATQGDATWVHDVIIAMEGESHSVQ